MKLGPGKTTKPAQYKHERLFSDHRQCPPLRELFPHVGQLRIELIFSDANASTPSPQLHTLYPAAAALFRFCCPCGDCDGQFDLTGPVAALAERAVGRRQATLSSSGQLCCQGVRLRDLAFQKNCAMQLNFRVSVDRAGAADAQPA